MQLKNTLIGAIVGGLVGMGVLLAAFMIFRTQHTALALVVAVLVGVIVAEQLAAARRTGRGEPSPLERLEAHAGG